jgi:hypothetical protein
VETYERCRLSFSLLYDYFLVHGALKLLTRAGTAALQYVIKAAAGEIYQIYLVLQPSFVVDLLLGGRGAVAVAVGGVGYLVVGTVRRRVFAVFTLEKWHLGRGDTLVPKAAFVNGF